MNNDVSGGALEARARDMRVVAAPVNRSAWGGMLDSAAVLWSEAKSFLVSRRKRRWQIEPFGFDTPVYHPWTRLVARVEEHPNQVELIFDTNGLAVQRARAETLGNTIAVEVELGSGVKLRRASPSPLSTFEGDPTVRVEPDAVYVELKRRAAQAKRRKPPTRTATSRAASNQRKRG